MDKYQLMKGEVLQIGPRSPENIGQIDTTKLLSQKERMAKQPSPKMIGCERGFFSGLND